jgi:HD-GYP domain-containing protein (c-di-GMP phosphodiesterase class II)
VVKDVMDNLIGNYQVFSKLTQTKSHDLVTFSHLLNVGILSICLSDKLGFKQDDCLDIGMAGLFHDIGKLYIEKRIVQKHTKLSEQEFSQIESHTIFGSEILLRYVEDLTALPLVVAFEHHLGWKSGGYPKMLFPHRPHVASLIVSIADVYDALSQRRAYKRSYSSDHVYGIMIKLKTKKFAPELLDKFFQIMGVWSKGTVVLLEDDRVAIVREQNQEDIFSPKVELVAKGPKTIIDLKKESDIKIKRSLDPGTEGKKYLDLI